MVIRGGLLGATLKALVLVTERKQSTVIQGFDRAFAAAHDLADLGVGKAFNKLEDQQLLALFGQESDSCSEQLMCFAALREALRGLAPQCCDHQFVKRHQFAAFPISVPIYDQVMGNAVEPRRKRHATIHISWNVLEGAREYAGR